MLRNGVFRWESPKQGVKKLTLGADHDMLLWRHVHSRDWMKFRGNMYVIITLSEKVVKSVLYFEHFMVPYINKKGSAKTNTII